MNNIYINYLDSDKIVVYYLCKDIILKEDDYKKIIMKIDKKLNFKYDIELNGLYDVDIYFRKGIYIFEFNLIDLYDIKDFNITLYLNSIILLEFDDFDLFLGNKIYYKNKYYIEIDSILDNILLFEYGNIIYGNDTKNIKENGVLII